MLRLASSPRDSILALTAILGIRRRTGDRFAAGAAVGVPEPATISGWVAGGAGTAATGWEALTGSPASGMTAARMHRPRTTVRPNIGPDSRLRPANALRKLLGI